MSNERPDNEISWGNKLDDPDGVSPEPWAGKDAAWEKLYSRLHEKPRRRIPFWYWAAAACLLGALYLGIRPGDLRRGSPGVVPAEKRTEGAGEQEATGRVTGERRGAGRAAAGAGRVVAGAETGASVILNKRPAATFRKIGQSVAKRPVTTGQPVAVPSLDTTITLAKLIVPPVRKKLRVVSINELSDPEPEAGTLAANSATNEKNNKSTVGYTRKHAEFGGTPFFRLIPSRSPALSNTMAVTESTHYQLVKIKLSPQN